MMENSINIRAELERLEIFPAMPELAHKIVALGSHPDVNDLVAIVEIDPGLASQIVRQATSPFFGYRGKVDSLRDAITRVLGVDRAMYLAYGVATGKALRSPADGPVGRKTVWVHSAYSAALMESLAGCLPKAAGIAPGICYLCGLMHNIGFLLLGHLFPAELHALNKAVLDNPRTPIIDLEQSLYMSNHAEMGMWLMKKWNMPAEVATAVHMHHDANYRGQYAAYANLALIADRVLQRLDMGDGGSGDLPIVLLNTLGLQEADVLGALQNLLDARSDLDSLATHLAGTA
jgi:HD-like signal output (HDOD) protein